MNDIVVVDNKPLTAVEIRANVNRIQEVMKAVMVKDVHFGTIPGTQKPTLYKAGSEKILATFRIAVELEVEDLSGPDCFRYRVKARGIIPTGEIVGCGIGECSTDEEKYRWRGVVCDAEWEATPEDRKRIKYSRPSQYNKEGVTRQIRTNPADLANTVLKMAKKRAQIDLTLTATAASDVFEQDIEDLPEEYREGMRDEQQPKGKPNVQQPQSKSEGKKEQTPQNGNRDNKTINENQTRLIYARLKAAEIADTDFCAAYNIENVIDLPAHLMNEALDIIAKGLIKTASSTEPQEEPPAGDEQGALL